MNYPEQIAALWQAKMFETPGIAKGDNETDVRTLRRMLYCEDHIGEPARGALAPRVHSDEGVLEFRAHEATLDPCLVLVWARLAERLVHIALQPAPRYKRVLERINNRLDKGDYTIEEMLGDLGMFDHDIHIFSLRMRLHRLREESEDEGEEAVVRPWAKDEYRYFVPPMDQECPFEMRFEDSEAGPSNHGDKRKDRDDGPADDKPS